MSHVNEASGGRRFSTLQKPPDEGDLSMRRMKPRSLTVSLAYRLTRVSRHMLGRTRLLRLCLNASWLFRRFAYELTGEVFGDSFYCSTSALSDKIFKQWIPNGGSVIDVGCGTGRWSRIAARYAQTVLGVDCNSGSIAIAQSLSNEPNIEYVVGDITQGLDGRKFDVALLVHVLEHIDEADKFLVSIRSIASTLIIEVPDFGADPLNVVRYELKCPYYSDGDHVREYTLGILYQQLERNGWQIRYHGQCVGSILVVASARPLQNPSKMTAEADSLVSHPSKSMEI